MVTCWCDRTFSCISQEMQEVSVMFLENLVSRYFGIVLKYCLRKCFKVIQKMQLLNAILYEYFYNYVILH